MGNWIYVIIFIIYIFYQVQQSRKKKEKQEEIRKQADASPGSPDKEITTTTAEERMREVFRQIEMKTNPYARPQKPVVQKKAERQDYRTTSRETTKHIKKQQPVPFLNVDMTEEEVLPEGSPSGFSDAFTKGQVSNFDYSAIEKKPVAKFNLRNAMIGKIIFDRPDW